MTHKKAKTYDEAAELENRQEGQPHGWIQWKGTDLCMDFHCACGEHTHIDCNFVYAVKCGACGKVYRLNAHVEAIEVEDEESCHIEPKVTDWDGSKEEAIDVEKTESVFGTVRTLSADETKQLKDILTSRVGNYRIAEISEFAPLSPTWLNAERRERLKEFLGENPTVRVYGDSATVRTRTLKDFSAKIKKIDSDS